MAAGGSAPELFTSLIGVFAESDVGFGTIVGSAVFNVLFVIGLCGYFAKDGIALSVWPLARDCSYYLFGLGMLAWCAADEEVCMPLCVCLWLSLCVCLCVSLCLFPSLADSHADSPSVSVCAQADSLHDCLSLSHRLTSCVC